MADARGLGPRGADRGQLLVAWRGAVPFRNGVPKGTGSLAYARLYSRFGLRRGCKTGGVSGEVPLTVPSAPAPGVRRTRIEKSGQSGAVCYDVQEVQAQATTLERRDATCAGSEGPCLLQSSRLPVERFGEHRRGAPTSPRPRGFLPLGFHDQSHCARKGPTLHRYPRPDTQVVDCPPVAHTRERGPEKPVPDSQWSQTP